MSNLDLAIREAAKLHSGQFRDGEEPLPYIVHPVEVLTNLRTVGGVTDEEMLVAAALHDTIEEANAALGKLTEKFGERAGRLVWELTRVEPTKEQTKGMTAEQKWRLRSDMLLDEIAQMSDDAKVIKLADRLSNLREALRTRNGERLERYMTQTRDILVVIPRELNPPLWDAVQALCG